MSRLDREREWLRPLLVAEFWKVYELLAVALVSARVAESDEPFVRAFLRWGLLGASPAFLPSESAARILEDVMAGGAGEPGSTEATLVYYADEYLERTAAGRITPSIDEDLELNHRQTPLWFADRSWRRRIHSRTMTDLLRDASGRIERQLKEAEAEQASLEARVEEAEDRREQASLRGRIQASKVEQGRLARAVERIREESLPRIERLAAEARGTLEESDAAIDGLSIVHQEVAGLRRVCRLVAHLKEPFLPFALRESFRPDQGVVHDRPTLGSALENAEYRDPDLFREPLFPGPRARQRFHVRQSPVVVILPAPGEMGYVWNMRQGSEFGRIAIPAQAARPRMLERMLWEALADFRYDTSRASAGIDFLKSDTLAAGYARVRWNYRKKPPDVRKRAAIYPEEKDRLNWRRHYLLYMESADEAGRKLFWRCPEAYEVVVEYLSLPAGCEVLRKR